MADQGMIRLSVREHGTGIPPTPSGDLRPLFPCTCRAAIGGSRLGVVHQQPDRLASRRAY
jgi:hypothetical protein